MRVAALQLSRLQLAAICRHAEEAAPEESQIKRRYSEENRSLLLEGLKGRNSAIQLDNYNRQQRLFNNEDEGVRVEAVK